MSTNMYTQNELCINWTCDVCWCSFQHVDRTESVSMISLQYTDETQICDTI